MEYEGQICRSPMERASFMLPVSVGCAYNQCYFCMLFKHLKYRELPLEQVESELLRVRQAGGNPKTVFLGDGSAFQLSAERLLRILELVHRYFPGCTAVNMDATVPSILEKTDKELSALARAGVSHLYLGIESGLDDVLTLMNKGHTMAQACEAIERLKRAGMIYDAHMMTGVAGRGRGEENARAMALFYNRTGPGRIVNFSMFVHRDAPLYRLIEQGRFTPADELENLREERLLLSELTVPVDYDGFHDVIPFRVRGILPRDRDKMLRRLDAAIEAQREKEPLVAWA